MEIIANVFLFLSASLLLINLTPRDLFTYYKKQKQALQMLKLKINILGDLPEGVNVNPENSRMSIAQDQETFVTLKQMARKYSPLSNEINWENIIGIGYSRISAPVGIYTIEAIRPLYIVEMPVGDSTTFVLKPIGILDDFQKWFLTQHNSFVNSVALLFLLIGFAFQLISVF